MKNKKFYEMTDEEMIALIKEGKVHHRRCDVCGCELAMPDVGVYTREGLNTVTCTICSNTRQFHDLVTYIEELKKTLSKKEILDVLDKRMEETWGNASIFTVEEWKEQTKEDD